MENYKLKQNIEIISDKVYEVIWIDSAFDKGWVSTDSNNPLPKIRTFGIITKKDGVMLEVSSSISQDNMKLNPLGIPLGAILEINELKEEENCV